MRYKSGNKIISLNILRHSSFSNIRGHSLFGKAVYDIGRNDGSRMEIDHTGQVELSLKPEVSDNFTPYYNNMYGTDEE